MRFDLSVSRHAFLRALVVLLSVLAASWCALGQTRTRVAEVFVALADNQHQGIVPVPPKLGNGDAPASNLYWGAAFGVKTYFHARKDWELIYDGSGASSAVLERCVFRYRALPVYLVADAYRGSEIRQAVTDFLSAAAGRNPQSLNVRAKSQAVALSIGGAASLRRTRCIHGFPDLADFRKWRENSARHHPGLREQNLLCAVSETNWRNSLAVDHGPNGARGVHT
jgi:hypothetical protein